MERYIRTKGGKIYDTKAHAYTWTTPRGIGLSVCANYDIFIPNSLIEKRSDNLDELCDCYVCVGKKHVVWDKELNRDVTLEGIKLSYDTTHFVIYGAIWTDKGLIYVAKMNEKGEFELL